MSFNGCQTCRIRRKGVRHLFDCALPSLISIIPDYRRIVEAQYQKATAIANLALDLILNAYEATANVFLPDTAYVASNKRDFTFE